MTVLLLSATAGTTCTKATTDYPLLTGGAGGTGGGGSSTSTTTTSTSTTGTGGAMTCTDKVQNEAETDIDCGGGTCPKCADGKKCQANADCASDNCDAAGNVCAPNPCTDTIKNGDETDVDCGGGTCAGCANGKDCVVDADCAEAFCDTSVTPAKCAAPSCTDTIRNGNETDVDCGGACPACAGGQACEVGDDCQSGVCTGNVCADPSCIDEVQNGTETDIDCGGSCATKCGDGKHCEVDGDCGGGFCDVAATPAVCKTPTCNDGITDGTESDVDCGGTCTKCADGKNCNGPSDCVSQICTGGKCVSPTCTDGVKNGGETDVDCGGTGVCPRCPLTKTCTQPADCASGTCNGGLCVCPAGMVTAPKLGGGAYCIDAKEVTYKQYQIFYTANPPTANQSAQCLWNTNYSPKGDWPALPNREEEPVRYVNWCQAEAYCRYNGRRLCGSIAGGASPQASFNDPSVSAWYNACSAQGTNPYPYGNAFQASYCVSALNPLTPAPDLTGKNLSCQGGVPTQYDMSGNVAEWEDSCSGISGKSDSCLVRGGSWQSSTPESLSCDGGGTAVGRTRDYTGADVGFRCCL